MNSVQQRNFSLFISGRLIFIVYRMPIQNKAKLVIRSFITENRDALSFINRYQGLKQLFIFAMITNFLVAPIIMVVFPFILKKGIGFNSQQYGYLMTILERNQKNYAL